VSCYNINNSCIKEIKAFYSAQKDSKNTRLKVMNEFLEAENEASRVEAAYARSVEKKPPKSILENDHNRLLLRVLDLLLLGLVQARIGYAENLWLKLFLEVFLDWRRNPNRSSRQRRHG